MHSRDSARKRAEIVDLYQQVDEAIERLDARSRERFQADSAQNRRLSEIEASIEASFSEALIEACLPGSASVRCYVDGVAVRLKTEFGELLAKDKTETLDGDFSPAGAVERLVEELVGKWNEFAPVGSAGTTVVKLWRKGHRFAVESTVGFEAVELEISPGSKIEASSAGIPLLHRPEAGSKHLVDLAIAKGWARIRADSRTESESDPDSRHP